jgi:hypothetical protein
VQSCWREPLLEASPCRTHEPVGAAIAQLAHTRGRGYRASRILPCQTLNARGRAAHPDARLVRPYAAYCAAIRGYYAHAGRIGTSQEQRTLSLLVAESGMPVPGPRRIRAGLAGSAGACSGSRFVLTAHAVCAGGRWQEGTYRLQCCTSLLVQAPESSLPRCCTCQQNTPRTRWRHCQMNSCLHCKSCTNSTRYCLCMPQCHT